MSSTTDVYLQVGPIRILRLNPYWFSALPEVYERVVESVLAKAVPRRGSRRRHGESDTHT